MKLSQFMVKLKPSGIFTNRTVVVAYSMLAKVNGKPPPSLTPNSSVISDILFLPSRLEMFVLLTMIGPVSLRPSLAPLVRFPAT